MKPGRCTVLVTLVLGSPPALLDRWLDDSRGIQGLGATLVPSQTLGRFLKERLQAISVTEPWDIMSLWDLARSALPEGVQVAPIGMEKALAYLLARDLGASMPADVPGIYLSAVRHALELRRRHISLPAFDGVAWPRILEWMEAVLPAAVYDEFRVYQYAANAASVHRPWRSLALYGYAEAHASQWQFITALASRYPTTVYTPWMQGHQNSLAEPWVALWRQLGAHVEELGGGPPPLRQHGVRVRRGTSGLEQAVRKIESLSGQDALLVVGAPDPEPLIRYARRRGQILAEDTRTQYLARNLWGAFWRIVRHEHDGADRFNWLEAMASQGVAGAEAWAFAQQWSGQLARAASWGEVARLVEQAARFHRMADLTQALSAAADWVVYDQWQWRPTVAVLGELWDLLPFRQPQMGRGSGLRWAHGVSARMLTAEVMAVAFVEDGVFPRNPAPDALWPAALAEEFGLPGPAHGREQDLHLLHLLTESGAHDIWWLGADPDGGRWPHGIGPQDEEEPVLRLLPVATRAPDWDQGPAQWYASHSDRNGFDCYTGVIGGEMGRAVAGMASSPSALEQFGTCPLAFFYARVLGIAEEAVVDPFAVPPSMRGQWVHRILEKMAKSGQEPSADAVRRWVEEACGQSPGVERIVGPVLRHVQEDIVREMLQAWPMVRPDKAEGLLTEQPVAFQAAAGSVTWQLSGRIDRIDGWNTDEIQITDYKTGTLPDPNKVRPDNLQMPLYRQAVQQQAPRAAVSARLLGVSWRNQFQQKSLDLAQFSEIKVGEILEQMARRMQAGEFLPLPSLSQDPCRLCAYTALCPADIKSEARRKHSRAQEYWTLWED